MLQPLGYWIRIGNQSDFTIQFRHPLVQRQQVLPRDQVVDTMHDLREHGVDVVTIGQYLQPSPKHAEIDRWVHPDEFRWFREQGEALGFGSVFAGPLVRSSYRADEQRHAAVTGRGAVAY